MSDPVKATPREIMADLLKRYTLDSLAKLQQEIGQIACAEVAKELHYKADSMSNQDDFHAGFMAAVGYIDPASNYFEGPVPSDLNPLTT